MRLILRFGQSFLRDRTQKFPFSELRKDFFGAVGKQSD